MRKAGALCFASLLMGALFLDAQVEPDRVVVGSMTIASFNLLTGLPLPQAPNERFCSLLNIGPNVVAWAYVPTSAERSGNFSAFSTPITDPQTNQPFPGNIIPVSRLPGVMGWRIAPTGPAPNEVCLPVPSNYPAFNNVAYVTGLNALLDTINVTPSTLTFSYQLGSGIPAPQLVSVTAARTALRYAIFPPSTYVQNAAFFESVPTWVTAEGACCQLSGTSARIVILPNQLTAGSYQATFTVQATGAISPPKTVTVNVTVTAPPNYLVLSTKTLNFNYSLQGGGFPPSQQFQVLSLGGASTFTAVARAVTPPNVQWFQVSPAAGSAPGAILTVSIDSKAAAVIGRGSFFGYIDVYAGSPPAASKGGARPLDQTSSGVPNSPQRVGVNLTVTPNPDFTVTPQSVVFQVAPDLPPPASRQIALAPVPNLDYQFVPSGYSVQITPLDPNDGSLISVAPAAVSIAGQLTVGVQAPAIPNLSAGEHDAVISFVGPGKPDLTTGSTITVGVIAFPPAAAVNPPSINSVLSAGGNVPGVTPGGWIAIYGSNLASTTHVLAGSDIVGDRLPVSLAGTSVSIDGIPAALSFVSPTQINALVPDDARRASVPIVVTTAIAPAATGSAMMSDVAPAFFPFPNNHVAAQHADYTNVANPSDIPGATPARSGEVILLYGTGFGATNPVTPSGPVVHTANLFANPVTVTIGNQPATVLFAGITEAGLSQINVVVPTLPNGEQPITATVKGVSTQPGLKLSVQN